MFNVFTPKGEYTTIAVTRRDGSVHEITIDTEDADRIRAYGSVTVAPTVRCVYARIRKRGTEASPELLHRFIMQPEGYMEIDHLNGDTLDNRKCNLRYATRSQNAQNRRGWRKSATGERNVYQGVDGRYYVIVTCYGFPDIEGAVECATAGRTAMQPSCPENLKIPLAVGE